MLAVLIPLSAAPSAFAEEISRYSGLCDASAAAALGPNHFVVADDERNTLQVYRRGRARPVMSIPLAGFLDTKTDKESDLEAAATLGSRIYWISSHARNSRGEFQDRRHRFFATRFRSGATPQLATVGTPYRDLLADLIKADTAFGYGLEKASRLPPEAPGGLNIEGLAATPDGGLIIGLRNPVPGGRALVIPLENPSDLLEGNKARFGKPIELDLGGRGVRSIERVGSHYLVVAGPAGDRGTFALYRWSGHPGDAAGLISGIDFGDLRPEALFTVPNSDLVQILSDDGGVETNGIACKDRPKATQSFRSALFKRRG